MKLVFDANKPNTPKVSIILLDWSCRESYHILHYLKEQTVKRDIFEIIWIEYYSQQPGKIRKWLEESIKGTNPILDKWMILDLNDDIYYHKHMMYNAGIVISRGDIIVICDSDAVVQPTFVDNIIKSFTENKNIVLHLDQIRSIEKKFYPFNYPSIEEIKASECPNIINGKPKGIVDSSQPLHAPNYGACFAALRKDLIAIGGADEHISYLGHICGPYDMTFRLINSGKNEIWHDNEWLYHVWHPGQSGDNNFAGPHDGRHMSQTALTARTTGRIFPLLENQAIKKLRLMQEDKPKLESPFETILFANVDTKTWSTSNNTYQLSHYQIGDNKINMMEQNNLNHREIRKLIIRLPISKSIIKYFFPKILTRLKQKGTNTNHSSQATHTLNQTTQRIKSIAHYWRTITTLFLRLKFNTFYIIGRCTQCLDDLNSIGTKTVVLWEDGCIADILTYISKRKNIQIKNVYKRQMFKELLNDNSDKIIIASFDNIKEKTDMLKQSGINPKKIVDLW